jgi:protein-S-isoprenylcysteine O-methyltransferase Ste14
MWSTRVDGVTFSPGDPTRTHEDAGGCCSGRPPSTEVAKSRGYGDADQDCACRNQMSTARNPTGVSPVQWRSTMNRLIVTLVILAVLLFVPAGRITWTRGWIFLLFFTLLMAASIAYFTRANPEIFAVRSRVHPGTKRWDKIVICLLFVAILAIPPVAGLDDGRFHLSSISWWVVALGYLVQLAGWIGVAWAETVNRFFEPGVRIQTERGHHVIDTGPYALIRHPGYFAAVPLFVGIALSLGSWWALIPAGFASLLLVLRTVWEDRTLHAELPGYAAYAHRVRFRLVPGVW